ncbi:MAG: TolC family outer membrane protein [Pseudomonadota bacterium]
MLRVWMFCGLGLIGMTAQAANLGEIYRMARANDPVFAAAQQAYQAGLEKLPQGRAGLLPSINLSASTRQNEVDSSLSGSRSYDTQSYSLALTQPLFRRQNFEAFEQGKLQALLAEQQLKSAEQQLVLRVAQAYFDVLQAEDDLAAARSEKEAYAEQLAQARRSFEVGTATIVDAHNAQASFDLAFSRELKAQNDLDVRRRALEKLLNAPAPRLARLAPKAQVARPDPEDMEAWVKQAEANGLSVLQAQTALEIARREVDRQRGGHYPTLDLAASYTDSRNGAVGTTTGIDTKTTVIGLELSLPLFQGGATTSRVREAVANQEKARFDLDNARRQATLEARQAYLGVVSGRAQIAALEQALVSTQAQLASSKLGLEVGVRTRVDVLNAEQQLYSTQRQLAAARYQTLLAGLQLKAAAGSLAEADVQVIDGLLKD